jgi:hypothetical protein
LAKYLPAGTVEEVGRYLQQYHIHLTIAGSGKPFWGDYRHRTVYQNHRISINGNLNPYAFLITLIHEIAHCSHLKNMVIGCWRMELNGKIFIVIC